MGTDREDAARAPGRGDGEPAGVPGRVQGVGRGGACARSWSQGCARPWRRSVLRRADDPAVAAAARLGRRLGADQWRRPFRAQHPGGPQLRVGLCGAAGGARRRVAGHLGRRAHESVLRPVRMAGRAADVLQGQAPGPGTPDPRAAQVRRRRARLRLRREPALGGGVGRGALRRSTTQRGRSTTRHGIR